MSYKNYQTYTQHKLKHLLMIHAQEEQRVEYNACFTKLDHYGCLNNNLTHCFSSQQGTTHVGILSNPGTDVVGKLETDSCHVVPNNKNATGNNQQPHRVGQHALSVIWQCAIELKDKNIRYKCCEPH